MRASLVPRVASLALLALAVGCAARTAPPLPSALPYADFMYPQVPAQLRTTPGAERVEVGWRFLQNERLVEAEREFSRALSRSPSLYPALTGAGYVALARRDYARALSRFDAAVGTAPTYVPALVGRGQTLLASGRSDDALAAFEAAVAADPTLTDVAGRVQVLRLKNLQDVIAAARTLAAQGRSADARLAYTQALGASPESAFLYRELGTLERRDGDLDLALTHFQKAVSLDDTDRESFMQVGELLEAKQDYAGAEAAYRRAAELEPGPEIAARVAVAAERARDARLPAEFRAIPASTRVTRGDLAALIGVRLEATLRQAPEQQVVVTDADRHWAAPWIGPVARTGILDAYENHTFQPSAPLRRAELAEAVRELVTLLARQSPELRVRLAERPPIADMSTGHLSYLDAVAAVASGVLPLTEQGRFEPNRPVSGAEAVDAIDRLRQLAGTVR